MAAVALAIWEERLRSGVSLDIDGLVTSPPPPPILEQPAPAITPTVADRAAAPSPSSPAPARPWIESIGVGVLGVGRGPTVGGRIDVRGEDASGRWRPRLSLAALGPQRLDFPPGEARWERVFGVAGTELVLWRRSVPRDRKPVAWALAGSAGAVLGWFHVSGRGFPDSRAASNFDAGGELGLRLEAGLGRWRPWLGAALFSWLRAQEVALSGGNDARSLPVWDAAVTLGIDFLPNR
jgi:hypothetical protein